MHILLVYYCIHNNYHYWCILLQELYISPYASINWPAERSNIAVGDLYTPHSKLLDMTLSKICNNLLPCISVIECYGWLSD